MLWQALARGGASLLLTAHDHHYERFQPLDALGRPAADGLTGFVVGTGGAPLYPLGRERAISAYRANDQWGVLRLELDAAAYRWEFRASDGSVRDAGQAACR